MAGETAPAIASFGAKDLRMQLIFEVCFLKVSADLAASTSHPSRVLEKAL
jgi:hypothetical protein